MAGRAAHAAADPLDRPADASRALGRAADGGEGPEVRDGVYRAVRVALDRLHAIDPAACGLAPQQGEGSTAAEVDRWEKLIERGEVISPDQIGRLLEGLRELAPPDEPPTMIHGDFHLGNIFFEGHEVSAVIDWEVAGVGPPLLDLGSLWVMTDLDRFAAVTSGPFSAYDPDRFLVGAENGGVEGERLQYFLALSLFKYAAILEYNRFLAVTGRRPDAFYATDRMASVIAGLAREAERRLELS